jgi:hypothetical protein
MGVSRLLDQRLLVESSAEKLVIAHPQVNSGGAVPSVASGPFWVYRGAKIDGEEQWRGSNT